MKIYDGKSRGNGDDDGDPVVRVEPSSGPFFYVGIGDTYAPGVVCGTRYEYIIAANDEDDAIKRMRQAFEKAIEMVFANMAPDDLVSALWERSIDRLDPEYRKLQSLRELIDRCSEDAEQAISDFQDEEMQILKSDGDPVAIELHSANAEAHRDKILILNERIESARAEIREIGSTKVVGSGSRFDQIVAKPKKEIGWIDKGYFRVERIDTDRPIDVAYFDDGRGNTAYLRRDR